MDSAESIGDTCLHARLAELSSDSLIAFTEDCEELLFVNSTFEDVWGLSPESLRDDPSAFFEGIHPEDRQTVRQALEKAKGGQSVNVECRVNPSDEYERWVSLQVDPECTDHGDVRRLLGSAREVTERNHLPSDVRCAQLITRNVPDGVYMFDPSDELVFANRAAVERSVGTREDMLGRTVRDLVEERAVGEESTDDIVSLHNAVATGETEEFRATLQFETVDGPQWFDVRSSRADTREDDRIYVITVMRDVTERVEVQDQLREQNERLDRFADVVAHDLRNPLNVATSYLGRAREEVTHEDLEPVARSHDRMAALIDDILAFAHSGDPVDNLAWLDIADVAIASWDSIETKSATLQTETAATVLADRALLRRFFDNLLRNAVEHGGQDVTITVGAFENGFFVADDGSGISDADRERLFDTGYSTSAEGTGFGLMIAAEVAEAHDWSIEVEESTAGGTRLTVTDAEISFPEGD